jgi:hypothetical protein
MSTDQLAQIGVAAAVASSIAAMFGLLLLIQNFRTARQQSRRDEMRMVALLSERWEALRADWHVAVMRARGPSDFYVEVEARTRADFSEKLRRLKEADEALHGITGNPDEFAAESLAMMNELSAYLGRESTIDEILELYAADTDPGLKLEFDRLVQERFGRELERSRPLFEKHSEALAAIAPYQIATRKVLRLLGEVCGQILRGLVSAQSVYEAFGAELARQGGAIRTLLRDTERTWSEVQPGLALRVLVLVDLMWAEGARLGELNTQPSPQSAAMTKKNLGTGRRNRRRAFELAIKLGTRRNARRVARLLTHAEHPAATLDWAEVTGLANERLEMD